MQDVPNRHITMRIELRCSIEVSTHDTSVDGPGHVGWTLSSSGMPPWHSGSIGKVPLMMQAEVIGTSVDAQLEETLECRPVCTAMARDIRSAVHAHD